MHQLTLLGNTGSSVWGRELQSKVRVWQKMESSVNKKLYQQKLLRRDWINSWSQTAQLNTSICWTFQEFHYKIHLKKKTEKVQYFLSGIHSSNFSFCVLLQWMHLWFASLTWCSSFVFNPPSLIIINFESVLLVENKNPSLVIRPRQGPVILATVLVPRSN